MVIAQLILSCPRKRKLSKQTFLRSLKLTSRNFRDHQFVTHLADNDVTRCDKTGVVTVVRLIWLTTLSVRPSRFTPTPRSQSGIERMLVSSTAAKCFVGTDPRKEKFD